MVTLLNGNLHLSVTMTWLLLMTKHQKDDEIGLNAQNI